MYVKKATMPSSYEIARPFGVFVIGREQLESDAERQADDSVQFTYNGVRITRGQYRDMLAERDRLAEIDAERVTAANEERAAFLAYQAQAAVNARAVRQATKRQTLEARITWAEGELARAESKYRSECERLGAIKAKAELELLGL
jgi:hypothetical protein